MGTLNNSITPCLRYPTSNTGSQREPQEVMQFIPTPAGTYQFTKKCFKWKIKYTSRWFQRHDENKIISLFDFFKRSRLSLLGLSYCLSFIQKPEFTTDPKEEGLKKVEFMRAEDHVYLVTTVSPLLP